MRALVEGLETPHPIALQLPGLFQDDDFTRRFTSALDEVLAPIFVTLDAIEAYVDPWLTPDDFLLWLSEWVGIPVDHGLPQERKRALVAGAASLYGWAGTAKGIADLVELYSGVRPEVVDSGGVAWSPTPDGDIPGSDDAQVSVRFPAGAAVDVARVHRLLEATLPAHVAASVEVSQR
ncbi:MAG: phage tail protein [Actinobacteria bacterium]|nr:phage tail protein [Actinomycetota bacterium]